MPRQHVCVSRPQEPQRSSGVKLVDAPLQPTSDSSARPGFDTRFTPRRRAAPHLRTSRALSEAALNCVDPRSPPRPSYRSGRRTLSRCACTSVASPANTLNQRSDLLCASYRRPPRAPADHRLLGDRPRSVAEDRADRRLSVAELLLMTFHEVLIGIRKVVNDLDLSRRTAEDLRVQHLLSVCCVNVSGISIEGPRPAVKAIPARHVRLQQAHPVGRLSSQPRERARAILRRLAWDKLRPTKR